MKAFGFKCPNCECDGHYNERWDAVYCPSCKKWLEARCSAGKDCEFCGDRPERAP